MLLGFIYSSLLAFIYYRLTLHSRVFQLLTTLFLCLSLGLAWRAGFNAIEYHILQSANNQFKFWGYFHNGKSAVMHLLIWSAGYWLLTYHFMLEKQKNIQQKFQLDAKEANLKMLQYQITPHFLFNVLSGLDTLILRGDATGARNMLQKLSGYLRQTLKAENIEGQLLDQEIAQCKLYLEIERLRFGDKLSTNWELPEIIPNCTIPTGVLLPLFENAVKHGGLNNSERTMIDVKLTSSEYQIILELSNTLGELKKKEGFGIGLNNTQKRLEGYFGERIHFSTSSRANRFYVILVLNL